MTCVPINRKPLASVTDRTEIEYEVGNPCSKTQHDAAVAELLSVGWHVSYVLHVRAADGTLRDVSIMRHR